MTVIHHDDDMMRLTPKFFKLINGTSLLAYAAPITEANTWYLDRPLTVVSDVDPDSAKSQLLMFPLIPTTLSTQKHVILEVSKILFVIDVVESVGEYVKKFSSDYYDKEYDRSVKEIGKREKNDDVLGLLKSLEGNDDNGSDEGGGSPA